MANVKNDQWINGLSYGLRDAGNFDIITPYWMNFIAVEYANKQSIRDNDSDEIDKYADISLPMPRNIITKNSIKYTEGQTETTGGITDPTTGGFWESVFTIGGLTTWFKDVTGASSWAGQRPMDERDSIFRGANFRKHSYEWTLINKYPSQGKEIAEIANAFQSLAYPFLADDQYYSRVIHPPVWYIEQFGYTNESGGEFNNQRVWKKMRRVERGLGSHQDVDPSVWDMHPLPSVLVSADIQTAGAAADGVYSGHGGYPAATKISLVFQELEPAINDGQRLRSRSQIRGGEYTTPGGFWDNTVGSF
jgi:hypothetical protein